MRKRSILGLIIVALILAGCPATTVSLTALQRAELAYTDFADGYTLAMQTATKLRANGQISDALWATIDNAQKQVRLQQPLVRALLDQWAATQVKPATVDGAMSSLTSNLSTIKGVNNSVGGK